MISKQTFPPDLAALPQWVCWRLEPDPKSSRDAKVPYCPSTGKRASSNNPTTWGTLEEALYAKDKYLFSGIGFMFTAGCGIIGIDVDHCLDKGQPNETAAAILAKLPPTYIEISPSGQGLHIFLKGKLPPGGHKNTTLGVEMYADRRYFTMTGKRWPTCADTVAEGQDAIDFIHASFIRIPKSRKSSVVSVGKPLEDNELLDLARASRDKDDFNQLWDGQWRDKFKSQSEADFALCRKLAFWSGRDEGQIDRLFRQSGLFRAKWDTRRHADGATYGGEIVYTYWRDYDETRPNEKSGGVILYRDEVLHIPGLSYNGLVGYSPISLAKNAIGIAAAAEEYGSRFFANGAAPSGVVEMPGVVNDPVKIKATWEKTYRGFQNAHKVAILEQGAKFHPVSIPPDQAQFLETRKFQLDEIARVFRVPPHLIGDLEKSTFSNIEQQSLEFVMFTVEPWIVRIEQAMMLSLFTPAEQKTHVLKFNLDGLMRGDFTARMNGYKTGRQNGWLSANDIRRYENLSLIPAEEGGDRYLVNGNMMDLRDLKMITNRMEETK